MPTLQTKNSSELKGELLAELDGWSPVLTQNERPVIRSLRNIIRTTNSHGALKEIASLPVFTTGERNGAISKETMSAVREFINSVGSVKAGIESLKRNASN